MCPLNLQTSVTYQIPQLVLFVFIIMSEVRGKHNLLITNLQLYLKFLSILFLYPQVVAKPRAANIIFENYCKS